MIPNLCAGQALPFTPKLTKGDGAPFTGGFEMEFPYSLLEIVLEEDVFVNTEW